MTETTSTQTDRPVPQRIDSDRLIDALDLHSRLLAFEERERAHRAKEKDEREEAAGARQLDGWNLSSFAVVGLAMGLFSGLSASPIVGTLLPILFGLLGGAGGLYLLAGDAMKKATSLRFNQLGRPTAAFVGLCVLGAFIGISIRTGAPLSRMTPTLVSSDPAVDPTLAGLSLDDRLQVLALRARLDALDVADADRTAMLNQAHEAFSNRSAAAQVHAFPQNAANAWVKALRAAATATAKLQVPADATQAPQLKEQLAQLNAMLKGTLADVQAWEQESADVRARLLQRRATEVSSSLIGDPTKGVAWGDDEARAALTVLDVATDDLRAAFEKPDVAFADTTGVRSLDHTLELLKTGHAKTAASFKTRDLASNGMPEPASDVF